MASRVSTVPHPEHGVHVEVHGHVERSFPGTQHQLPGLRSGHRQEVARARAAVGQALHGRVQALGGGRAGVQHLEGKQAHGVSRRQVKIPVIKNGCFHYCSLHVVNLPK